MLILETMVAMTKGELVNLISESLEEVPEPSDLYDDRGEIVQVALTHYMADVFVKMQRLIDAMRKKGNGRREETAGSAR
jgi:hypothetical protein